MYVCVCNGITDRDVVAAVESGVGSLQELTARTGCGGGCGCCLDYAQQLLDQHQARVLPLPIALAA